MYDIIIAGAGICGLTAANELLSKGFKCALLEARNRAGGRIFSAHEPSFPFPIELGAEFIHGEQSYTIKLFNKAGIDFTKKNGHTYRVENNELTEDESFIKGKAMILKMISDMKEDIPFSQFINRYLVDNKFKEIKNTLIRLIEGYDAADVKLISSFALKKEWEEGGIADPYIIPYGHTQLVNYLVQELKNKGGEVNLSTAVKEVKIKDDHVEIFCSDGKTYLSKKIIITTPPSVLLSGGEGSIKFSIPMKKTFAAFQKLGTGSVIKLFLLFHKPFWESNHGRSLPNPSFIFSDRTSIKAWWTQAPQSNVLTGWISGPETEKYINSSDDEILSAAFDSLSYIFSLNKNFIKDNLINHKIYNWQNDPYSCGAYSYETTDSKSAKDIITTPVEGKIFFAGEALSKKGAMGTVEAAVSSAYEVAELISNY
jgi:monoamine oxidase